MANEENDLRVDPQYRKDYSRGWSSSSRGGSLDAADGRGEPDAWYDGYLDNAAGRPRWHYATCRDRDHHEACDGLPAPVADDAPSFDEVEAMGLDGTLRTIGRPYSPTDLASPLISRLGEEVVLSDGTVGVLSSVTVDGMATVAGYDGIVLAVVPAGEVVGR